MGRVVPATGRLAALQFHLHGVEKFRNDDRRMAALDVILRHLALVDQEVHRELLLLDGVALVRIPADLNGKTENT